MSFISKYFSYNFRFPHFAQLIHSYQTSQSLENDEKTKGAKKVLKLISAEIDSVKTCVQCHINANARETYARWFPMVCRKPHLIIWAQRKNARYWPAKVMSFDEKQVNVRFFGDYHKHENVAVKKCFLYSKESPTNYPLKKSDKKFKSALKV